MKKIFNKTLSFVLVLSLLLGLFSGLNFNSFADDLPSSGSCGDNVTYTFDSSTGLLTISGSGAINNYSNNSSARSPFYNQTSIKTIVINSGVTRIGSYAFSGCTGLTSITIPGSVTRIGSDAFTGCSALTSITIPDSVTSIGSGAFYGTGYYNNSSNWNKNLLYIGNHLIAATTSLSGAYTIESGTKTIAGNAFLSCSGLTSITIPDSVTSIGSYAFYDCSGLTNLTIGDSVTSIGYEAFYNCTGLTSITIPDSVTSIGGYAFSGTGYYNNSSNWNNNVLYIGNHLIAATTSLSGAYTIKSGTKTIADYAFFNCSKLTSITIPDSVTSIGEYAFFWCDNLTKVNITDLAAWCRISFSEYTANPFYCSNHLYLNDELLTDLVIPDSVTSIGKYAFYGCTGLTSITIPDSVTSIGREAFEGCYSLTIITIPDSVTSIGREAFYNCSGLTSVTIGNSVTSIGNYAFYGCSGLTNVTIGNSVTSIGNSAFRDCSALTSITIPDSVTSIGGAAFYGCSGLTNVTIGNSVTSIDTCVFLGCSSLTSITIPDTVTSIASSAFYNCSGLTNVTIGNSVTSIGSSAFSGCSGLTSTTIPNSVTSIGYGAFRACSGLTSITIPDTVTSIGGEAFYACSGLKELTMPASAKIYNSSNTFYNCTNIEKVTLTKGTGIMQNYASSTGYSDTYYQYTPWYISQNSLKELVIENGITNIGNSAFYGCSDLTKIIIPYSVTSIGDDAFYGCSGLKELTMPCSAKINNSLNTFNNCNNIEKVTLTKGTGTMQNYGTSTSSSATDTYYQYTPWYLSRNNLKTLIIENGITNIGNYAFCECTALTSVDIPDSVTNIGEYAFDGCNNLKHLILGTGIQTINKTAFANLNQITLPVDKKIDFSCFDNCNDLQTVNLTSGSGTMVDWSNSYSESLWYLHKDTIREINLEEGIKNISESAFYGCTNLIKTNVPSTVTTIGRYAYYGCSNLRNITISSFKCEILGNENTIDSFATIYGYENSTAQQYANKYNRDFVSLGEFACQHTEVVIDKAVEPSCTKTGLTQGTHCAFCLKVLVEQQVVPVLTHNCEEAITTPATCLNEGLATYTCNRCGYSYTASIPATGHSYKKVVTAPKANAVGYTQYQCACGEWQTDEAGKVIRDTFTSPTGKISGLKCASRAATSEKFSWSKTSGVSGYQVQISTKDGKKWDKTYDAKTATSYTVKSLTAGSAYKVRVRFYITKNGKNYYGAWVTINSPTLPKATKVTSATAAKKAFTAKWGKVAGVTGYQLQYATNTKFTKATTKTIKSATKYSLKVSSLKANTKYFVRVRTYKTIGGKNYYSTWSPAKAVTTKK